MTEITCTIVEDRSAEGKGFCYRDKVLLEGEMAEWPKSIPQGSNTFLRVVLNEDNWASVKDVLFQLKPYKHAKIPRDFAQYINEANMPAAYSVVAPVWKKPTLSVDRSLRHRQLPSTKLKDAPSSSNSKAAEKLATEANKVRLPEPPHIPESAFFANNPNSATFKFPSDGFVRAASVAKAELAAQQEGQELASDDSQESEEEDDEGMSDAVSYDIEESEDEDEEEEWQPTDIDDQLWTDDPKEKIVKGSKAKNNPFDECSKKFRAQKEASILQGRKKDKYGGKRGSRAVASKTKPPPPKRRVRVSTVFKDNDDNDDDSDYFGDSEDAMETLSVKTKSRTKGRTTATSKGKSTASALIHSSPASADLTFNGSPASAGLIFKHHVTRGLPSLALRYKFEGVGSSCLVGTRPRSRRQQLDSKVRQKLNGVQKQLQAAQRMTTTIKRSDSFDANNKDPKYLAEREKEAKFPVIMHMMCTYTEQVANGDGQNKKGVSALQTPRLLMCLDSEHNQLALEKALKSGNLEIHTFNHFPDYLKEFTTGIKRGRPKEDYSDDDESADPNNVI